MHRTLVRLAVWFVAVALLGAHAPHLRPALDGDAKFDIGLPASSAVALADKTRQGDGGDRGLDLALTGAVPWGPSFATSAGATEHRESRGPCAIPPCTRARGPPDSVRLA